MCLGLLLHFMFCSSRCIQQLLYTIRLPVPSFWVSHHAREGDTLRLGRAVGSQGCSLGSFDLSQVHCGIQGYFFSKNLCVCLVLFQLSLTDQPDAGAHPFPGSRAALSLVSLQLNTVTTTFVSPCLWLFTSGQRWTQITKRSFLYCSSPGAANWHFLGQNKAKGKFTSWGCCMKFVTVPHRKEEKDNK